MPKRGGRYYRGGRGSKTSPGSPKQNLQQSPPAPKDKESPSTTANLSTPTMENTRLYHAVYIPSDFETSVRTEAIFTSKTDALQFMKVNKNSRLMSFKTRDEAVAFCRYGVEDANVANDVVSSSEQQRFRAPTSKEIISFRKAIESSNLAKVKTMIWDNPRYLVGCGDTPTILQEGFRYNALHVAARAFDPMLCEIILNSISDVEFYRLMYGPKTSNIPERRGIMLDLYLNMPDKGLNETPLHFACKLGALEVVKVLVSYPQCDKERVNKNGLTPAQMVCSRARDIRLGYRDDILRLLGNNFFVPVLRAVDNSIPPIIGEPFAVHNCPAPKPSTSSPTVEISAIAGPMSEDFAKDFRKLWKTPPRRTNFNSPLKTPRPAVTDPDKGLERVGRVLASEHRVAWKEYWPFLGSFQNLASNDGLNALENYLGDRLFEELCDDNRGRAPDPLFSTPRNSLMTNILKAFKNLQITTPEGNDGASNTEVKQHEDSASQSQFIDIEAMFTESTKRLESSCQLYAERIAPAIIKGSQSSYMREIGSFQLYLASCITEKRIIGVDLRKAHVRLAALLGEKLITLAHKLPNWADNLRSNLRSEPDYKEYFNPLSPNSDNVVLAVTCIKARTFDFLTYILNPDFSIEPPSSHQDPIQLWSLAEPCECYLPRLNDTRRSLFNDDERSPGCQPTAWGLGTSGEQEAASRCNRHSNGSDEDHCDGRCQEDDNSEDDSSDNSFHTAPTSPESEEDAAVFHQCETGPIAFLTGNRPTKIDREALEALEGADIPTAQYPNIAMWLWACRKFSQYEPRDRWPSPKAKVRRVLKLS